MCHQCKKTNPVIAKKPTCCKQFCFLYIAFSFFQTWSIIFFIFLSSITLIFEKCHWSLIALTLVRYEYDSNVWHLLFQYKKCPWWKKNDEKNVVTPTSGWWLAVDDSDAAFLQPILMAIFLWCWSVIGCWWQLCYFSAIPSWWTSFCQHTMRGQAGISPTTQLNYISTWRGMHFGIESESHMVSRESFHKWFMS